MPYFEARTPPFVDPADYGQKKKPFSPTWLPKPTEPPPLEEPKTFSAPYRQPAASAPMEEPDVANYAEPKPLPTPQMRGWNSMDESRESSKRAKDVYGQYQREAELGPPTAPHNQTGFKKVMHTIGDIFLAPEVIHPNVSRQREQWAEGMQYLGKAAQAAEAKAEEDRKIAMAESQEALRNEQMETQRRQQSKIDWEMAKEPKPLSPINVAPGGTLVDPTGKVLYHSAPAPTKETPGEATVRRTKEADDLGLKGSDRTNYIAGRNVIRPPRAEGRGSQATFRAIEQNKSNRMLNAKKAAQKAEAELASATGEFGLPLSPQEREARRKKIWSDYEDQMQLIQQSYESEIISQGGSIAPQAPQTPAPASASTTSPAPTAQGTVKLMSPDGSEVMEVPADQAQHFINLGAKRL